jgi:hypothetical protein
MNIKGLFQSRTFWTFIALFIINGVSGVRDMIPGDYLGVVDGILTILGIYFRANPKTK